MMLVWGLIYAVLIFFVFVIAFEFIHHMTTIIIQSLDIDFDEEDLQTMCIDGLRNQRWDK